MGTTEKLHADFEKMPLTGDKKTSGMPLSGQLTPPVSDKHSPNRSAIELLQLGQRYKYLQIIKKCAVKNISVQIYAQKQNTPSFSGHSENMQPHEWKSVKAMQKYLIKNSEIQNVPIEKVIEGYDEQLKRKSRELMDIIHLSDKFKNMKCVVVPCWGCASPGKEKDIQVKEGSVAQNENPAAQYVHKEQETKVANSGKENSISESSVSYEDKDTEQDSEYVAAEKSFSACEDIEKKQALAYLPELAYLPQPKHILYAPGKIMMEWRWKIDIGAGLQNHGNTCFMNATLQCLTYTAPFVNYLIYDNHNGSCKLEGFCMSCAMQDHVARCMTSSDKAIDTKPFVDNLESIAKHMTFGNQEDAHEFLRYALDAMQKSSLGGRKDLDPLSKETTVINQIFGGYLRNQIVCVKCHAVDTKFEHFMDLNLSINDITTLNEAVDKFVVPECLEDYECSSCKEKGSTWKRFAIEASPNILTLQLNRFGGPCGKKLNHKVEFPEELDVRPFMTAEDGEPVMYKLYAVLVHAGATCNSGHYLAFVKNSQQQWYVMNDQKVLEFNAKFLSKIEPYLLFYKKEETSQIMELSG